jgi:acyl carrier protein
MRGRETLAYKTAITRRKQWKLELPTVSANVRDRILTLVRAILHRNSISADVLPESRLVDVGLTSMDMVNLMLSVEAEFDLTLPQSEITPDNFRSVQMIEQMLDKQLELRAGP